MGNSPGMMIDPNGEMTKYAETDNSFNEAVEAKRPILLGGGMISDRIWYHKMFGVNNDIVMYAGGGGSSSTVSDFLFMVNPGAYLPQSFSHYQAEYVYIEDKSHLPSDAVLDVDREVSLIIVRLKVVVLEWQALGNLKVQYQKLGKIA